jgi:hypothetical protein
MSKYKKRKKKAREKMNRKIMDIGTDEEAWENWVRFRAQFHQYSLSNAALIAAQDPDARFVRGYNQWIEMGRQVEAGESAIYIWVPYMKTADDEEEADEHGVDVGETYLAGFGTGAVFAWHQTKPITEEDLDDYDSNAQTAKAAGTETLPEPIPTLKGDEYQDLLRQMRAAAEADGHEVTTFRASVPEKGSYSPQTGTIRYRENLDANHAAKTVAHEWAHALTYERYDRDEIHDLGRDGLEIIAEGSAYLTCYMLGLDTSEYSFPYLKNHAPADEDDADEIRNAIESHLRAMDEISTDIREQVMTVRSETGTDAETVAPGRSPMETA